MKKNFRLLAVAALACILLVTASASAIVSPALNVLSKQNTLIKSGLVYSDIYFSEQDFKKCLGLSAVDSRERRYAEARHAAGCRGADRSL